MARGGAAGVSVRAARHAAIEPDLLLPLARHLADPLRELRLQSEDLLRDDHHLNDTLAEMLHNLYGEYLVERAEQMIRRREGGRAE